MAIAFVSSVGVLVCPYLLSPQTVTGSETVDAGDTVLGQPGTASLGLIQSGALEASTVELSDELVNMIVAQRSYQANAQVISTADQLTQTLLNIR